MHSLRRRALDIAGRISYNGSQTVRLRHPVYKQNQGISMENIGASAAAGALFALQGTSAVVRRGIALRRDSILYKEIFYVSVENIRIL